MSVRNIIIVSDFAHINGGAAKVALGSAVGLKAMGYNIVVFAAVAPIDDELTRHGIRVICLNQYDILNDKSRLNAMRQGIWNKKAKEKFRKLLEEFSPKDTVVHFHQWMKALSCSLFDVTANTDFKIVITLHDYFLFCPNGGVFNYQTKRICEKKASSLECLLCNCDARSYPQKIWRFARQIVQARTVAKNKNISIIYISRLNKEVSYPYLKRISERWYHVQNPVDVEKSDIVNIANNRKYLFFARLSAEKGVELFCRAITDLGLEGCVLGDGYLREELQAAYPNIEFAGWVTGEKKHELIHQGKALVFPSLWYEGAPLSIIEMKSYGMPCIVPDRCAASEEVEDGKTGFVFKTGDVESLKKSIQKYEKADISALQHNIVSNYNPDKYSLETHCRRLQEVYEEVLNAMKQVILPPHL